MSALETQLIANAELTRSVVESGARTPLPERGDIIDGRYRIVRMLGSGGMGAVFEAEHQVLGRRFALKFLQGQHAPASANVARFMREARLLGQLEHEHLPAVLDYGSHGRMPFFAMEFVEGMTFRQLLAERGPLPPAEVLTMMVQVACAMTYVHDRDVVHRDLKPDNLMLTRRGDGRQHVMVLDFGIARAAEEAGLQLTRSGAQLGTAHYMSPEQARGARQVDARSDIYALGAIAYELLSGARAHPGQSYNEVIFHLLMRSHEPLRTLCSAPQELIAIVERCLQKEPEARYANAGELADALARLDPAPLPNADVESAVRASARHASGRPSRAAWLAIGLAAGTAIGATASHTVLSHLALRVSSGTNGPVEPQPVNAAAAANAAPPSPVPIATSVPENTPTALPEPIVAVPADVSPRPPLRARSIEPASTPRVHAERRPVTTPRAAAQASSTPVSGGTSRPASSELTAPAVERATPEPPLARDSPFRFVTADPYASH